MFDTSFFYDYFIAVSIMDTHNQEFFNSLSMSFDTQRSNIGAKMLNEEYLANRREIVISKKGMISR